MLAAGRVKMATFAKAAMHFVGVAEFAALDTL
jgi:hypothetical protein